MKAIRYTYIFFFACFFMAAGVLSSCSKMDATYEEFIKDGERIYLGKADSIKTFAGKDRIKLSWLMISDTRINRAMIYWNNKSDSLLVPIQRTAGIDTIDVIIPTLEEGDYSFDIITFDAMNNRSIPVNTIGKVFGAQYESTLLNRLVKSAVHENNAATVILGSASENAVSTEFVFTDNGDVEKRVLFSAAMDTVELSNAKAGTSFHYRTLFLPEEKAIDTFYSVASSVRLKGVPVEYSKSDWSITASSFRTANPPSSAIDNNPSTVWINDAAAAVYPHSLTIDMKAIKPSNGFTFTQRTNANGQIASPSILLCEVQVSNDGQAWRSVGDFTLLDIGAKQFFELPDTDSFRYFRTIFKSSYNNVPNGAMAEIGMYVR